MAYTLPLALVDFLPVVFTAVGLFFIVRMVSHLDPAQGRAAAAGSLLTVAGGFFKAAWKLLMASSGGAVDIAWMEAGLFLWMAPGYTLIAWSIWQAVRTVQGKASLGAWRIPLLFIGLMFAGSLYLHAARPGSSAWERVLLSVMVLATVITGILLIAFSLRQRLPLAGGLFLLNLACILLLNGFARMDEQTIRLQWIEEGINAVSWLAFAFAARQVYAHTRARFGVDTAEPIRAANA